MDMFGRPLVYYEIERAREANDTERLERVLENSRDENGKQKIIFSDAFIEHLLFKAAGDDTNNGADVCRLLWNALSDNGRENIKQDSSTNPLFAAAALGNLEKVEFFVDDCNYDCFFQSGDPRVGNEALSCALGAPQNAAEICDILRTCGAGNVSCAVEDDLTEVVHLLLDDEDVKLPKGCVNAAMRNGNETILALLLKHGPPEGHAKCVDKAIRKGNETRLALLLQNGAPVGSLLRNDLRFMFQSPELVRRRVRYITVVHELLCDNKRSRKKKLGICRILVNHAASTHGNGNDVDHDHDFFAYLYVSLAACIDPYEEGQENHCAVLIEAGMDLLSALYDAVDGKSSCVAEWLGLLQTHGVNPFEKGFIRKRSAFRKAACLQDTDIFNHFLQAWEQHFDNGVNLKGNNIIHEICDGNKDVTLEAVQAVLGSFRSSSSSEQEESAVLSAVLSAGNHEGYTPVLLAANADASLDVICSLLKECPDALDPRPSKGALDAEIALLRQDKAILQAKVNALEADLETLSAENEKQSQDQEYLQATVNSLQAEADKNDPTAATMGGDGACNK